MKKNLLKFALLATALTFVFISCSDDDNEPWVAPEFKTSGAYILGEGRQGHNNAKLSYYDIDQNKLTSNVFENQNSKFKLGDIAQDILIYGSKMYITVTGSNAIYITDLEGKLMENGVILTTDKEIQYKEPRYLVAHNGSVYVDFYSGHIAKLDTTELKITANIEIAKYPEEMAVVNDELYVTNSQYWESGLPGNTVTVVDLGKFEIKGSPIEVRTNPTKIVSDNLGNVFVLSMGVYGVEKGALTLINSGTKAVKIIAEDVADKMAVQGDRLLLSKADYHDAKYSQYDIYGDKYIDTPFITIPENEKNVNNNPYHISIDPISKDIYLAMTDYETTGSMYVFSAKGEYKSHFNVGGINPQKVIFLSKQIN